MKTADAWPAFERHITFERGLAATSIRDSRWLLRPFLEWCTNHGIDDLHDLSPEHIGAWSLDAAQEMTEIMVARTSERVRTLCKWLHADGLWPVSPAEYLVVPVRNRVPPDIPSPWEVAKFMEAFPNTESGRYMLAVFELLYSTGMRLKEICSAKIEDLDLRKCTLRVRGKGAIDRIVVFGDEAAKRVAFYVEHIRPARALLALEKDRNNLFFSRLGTPLRGTIVHEQCRIVARRAKIQRRLHPHIFRHACASHMLAKGANIRELQVMLGHAKIETTALYTHATRDQLIGVHRNCHPRNLGKRFTYQDPGFVAARKIVAARCRERDERAAARIWKKIFGLNANTSSQWLNRHRPGDMKKFRAFRNEQRAAIDAEARAMCSIEDDKPNEVAVA